MGAKGREWEQEEEDGNKKKRMGTRRRGWEQEEEDGNEKKRMGTRRRGWEQRGANKAASWPVHRYMKSHIFCVT